MWGPLYVSGSAAGLLLWPLALLTFAIVVGLCVGAIGFGARGRRIALAGSGEGRRASLFGIVAGSVLAVLGLPVLWFGNAPLAVFG